MTTTAPTTLPNGNANHGGQRLDPRMGAFAWWDLESTRCTPDHIRAVLAAEGLTYTVPDIDPVGAVKRAVQEWSQGRGKSDRFKAEVVDTDGGKVYVGILKFKREGTREVGWEQTELLTFDTATKGWEPSHVSAEAKAFMELANGFATYLDHRFIRPSILQPELAAMHAIGLKRGGGFYFVALAKMDQLQRLKRVVGALGRSVLNIVTVENDPDSKAAVVESTREHVLGGIADVKANLTEWRESSRKIRTDSEAAVLGQLAELLQIASLYEGALEVSLTDLRTEIDACRTDAFALLAVDRKS